MRFFLLLIAVLATASAVSANDEDFDGDRSELRFSEAGCKCKNGRCVTDSRGKTKCACKVGYALQDEETCEVCDCGKNGKCFFSLERSGYQKKCLCDQGYAPKDGICVECVCGENSKCEFENGEKNCYCIEGYAQLNGVCTACDCGENGECKFVDGKKHCDCFEDYLVNNGKCEECNCGKQGTCSFQNGRRTCSCFDGYKEKQGICERCDCGSFGLGCRFDRQDKICQCKNGYAQSNGICRDCACGEKSDGCVFSNNNQKQCRCQKGYVQKGATCEMGCGVYRECGNGGKCDRGFCKCPPGTRGEFCEIIDACQTLCPNKRDTTCTYDVSRQTAVCLCNNPELKYDSSTAQCKKSCSNEILRCQNGGECVRVGDFSFCKCPPGTSGDMCEVVDECATKRLVCGADSRCVFDRASGRATCACVDPQKTYNAALKKCQLTCDENRRCKNGGVCPPNGGKFCNCLDGTSGDLCEIIDDCQKGLCGFDRSVECTFDINRKVGVCGCRDKTQKYDPASKTCKSCDCGPNSISCEYRNGKKVCSCPHAFADKNGRCEKIMCTQNKCFNGKCVIVNGQEVCKCYEGFTLEGGDYCRKLNCSNTLCHNGICMVRYGNIEECVCPAGHAYYKGECLRGKCSVHTCFGGLCKNIDGERVCICPDGYSLQGIGCFATVCKAQPCYGGWCEVVDFKEVCHCHEGYELVGNVCRLRFLCKTKKCFGGICSSASGQDVCTCPPGTVLDGDVCRRFG